MNIREAAKRKLPLKRHSWHDWLTVQECPCKTQFKKHAPSGCPAPALMFPDYVDPKLTPEDILAEDWEVHYGTIVNWEDHHSEGAGGDQ